MREECPSLEREQQIPMHHWRWPKEAFPFLLLPHGREREAMGRTSLEPCVREREVERERGDAMRKRGERDHGPDYRKKEKWARENLSKSALLEPFRAALPPPLTAERF
jgi:hypothetical protein